jgi:cytochrome c oxidase cbb3-type subunit 3
MRGAPLLAHFSLQALTLPPISSLTVLDAALRSPAQQARRPQSASSAKNHTGKQVLNSSCGTCHGLDGRGGQHAPNIATKPETLRLTDAELFRIVHDGSRSTDMPSFGSSLDTSQISAVVSYLRVLQGGQRAERLPGNPRAGEVLFSGKAGCAECHMVAGAGGFIAGDLTDFARSHPADAIREAITKPGKSPDPRARAAFVVTRDSIEFKGLVRNEDNFSLQLQSRDGTFHFIRKSDVQQFGYQPEPLMPADYASRLSPRELNDLISFLMRSARGKQVNATPAAHARRAGME